MIRDTLHLKAPGNWMNDPNGFLFYKGEYHLFYQHFPYAPVWGTMHWGHAVSRDLVHWEHRGVALFPTKEYDRNGIFSGSGIEKDGQLLLYYTAVNYLETDGENIHTAIDSRFESSQAMITSTDGHTFDNWKDKRMIIPVIRDEETGDPSHTRDPKVWRQGDQYLMVLGSTRRQKTGRLLFYRSLDALHWDYVSQYQNEAYGSIIECPDLFPAGDGHLFIGCPMDIQKDGMEYAHHAVCARAEFREEDCLLRLPDSYQYVDYGLDLYAPQTCLDAEGRRVLIGWMRMPEPVTDPERGTWNGMMSLPRVVETDDDHIYFRVHPDVDSYFDRELQDICSLDFRKPFRLKTELMEGETLDIGGYQIRAEGGRIHTDRRKVFREIDGLRNEFTSPPLHEGCHLDLFVEPNLIELFINDGEAVISNIVYGLEHRILHQGSSHSQISGSRIVASVPSPGRL